MPDPTVFVDLDGVVLDVAERYWRLHCDLLAPAPSPVDRATYWTNRRARGAIEDVVGGADPGGYRAGFAARIETPAYLRWDTVIPGAREALAAMGAQRPVVLVTLRRQRDALMAQLHDLDLARAFAAVLTAPHVGTADWEVKRDLIAGSPLQSSRATMVGDTEVDVRAGKALGMRTIAVLTGLRSHALLAAEGPDLILDSLAAVGDTVRGERT